MLLLCNFSLWRHLLLISTWGKYVRNSKEGHHTVNAASHSREKFQLVVMEPMTDAPVNVIPTVYCCCGTIIYVECLHRLSFLWPHDTIALAPFSKELRNICMGQAIYPVPTNTVRLLSWQMVTYIFTPEGLSTSLLNGGLKKSHPSSPNLLGPSSTLGEPF